MKQTKFRAFDKQNKVWLYQENESTEIKSLNDFFFQLQHD